MEHVEHQTASIVLLGNFNPAIFNPDWLARQEILSPSEVDMAKVEIIHADIAQFKTPGLDWEIIQERFTIHSSAEPFVRLADIVPEIFPVKLPHTPLHALGINFQVHFRVRDAAQWMSFGRQLAPLGPWGDWGETLESVSAKKAGGLVSLTMQQTVRPDNRHGFVRVNGRTLNKDRRRTWYTYRRE